jgi:hypothetical protein
MSIADKVDQNALRESHVLRLPEATVTCPECGTLRGPDEIRFIADMGWCRSCSDLPAYVRKQRAKNDKP